MKGTFAKFGSLAGAVTIALVTGGVAEAADFSFRGNFTADDDVQLFNFTVGAESTVTLRTFSYAGGTQADGTVIAAGGFDPILALFDSAGSLLDQNDDDPSGTVPADPVTGVAYDTLLTRLLAAGDYTVSIMQYDNFANGPTLADGFLRQGESNFSGGFIDFEGDQRTSAWAFDILNVSDVVVVPPDTAPIPTPALLPGLIGMGVAALRKKQGDSVAE